MEGAPALERRKLRDTACKRLAQRSEWLLSALSQAASAQHAPTGKRRPPRRLLQQLRLADAWLPREEQ
jgi:hypothetical protein